MRGPHQQPAQSLKRDKTLDKIARAISRNKAKVAPLVSSFANGVDAFRYNPVRDIACAQVKVPYGPVRVAGRNDFIRSHEMHLDNNDRSGFLPELERKADRQPWTRWREERKEMERQRTELLQREIEAAADEIASINQAMML